MSYNTIYTHTYTLPTVFTVIDNHPEANPHIQTNTSKNKPGTHKLS